VIQAGWAWAAVRQRDHDWAVALLGTRSRHRVDELLGLLDDAEFGDVLRRRLAQLGPADVQLLARYLDACPVPGRRQPPEVAVDVLAWLLARMRDLHPRQAQPLLNVMSYRFPIEAGPAVIAAADDLPLDDLWRTALRSVARLISVRTRIHEELQ
jgi:thioesterase domain-containing protein